MSALYMIVGTLVALGVLVTFHEFGHFWVALAGIFEVEDDVIDSGELLLEFLGLCLVGLEKDGRDLVVGGFEGDGEGGGHGGEIGRASCRERV